MSDKTIRVVTIWYLLAVAPVKKQQELQRQQYHRGRNLAFQPSLLFVPPPPPEALPPSSPLDDDLGLHGVR